MIIVGILLILFGLILSVYSGYVVILSKTASVNKIGVCATLCGIGVLIIVLGCSILSKVYFGY